MKITKEQLKQMIKEELEASLREVNLQDVAGKYIRLKSPEGEFKFYRIEVESALGGRGGINHYVMMAGQKVYLPMGPAGLEIPSVRTADELVGSSEPLKQGERIPLGQAQLGAGVMHPRRPSRSQMGQP